MTSRTEKLRRRQHRKEKKRRRASHGEMGFVPSGGFLTIRNPPGEVKMSEVLHTLVEPEWDNCRGEEDMRKLLTLGVVAWNAALLQAAKRTEMLESFARTLPTDMRDAFKLLVEPLVRRKEQLFPHIHRPILSYELTIQPSGEPYLEVVSGLS